jgi:hypothetical protein
LKPSPYFADRFSFFFYRFFSKASLFQWFLKKADAETEAFEYPSSLSGSHRTIVFLPSNREFTALIIANLERFWDPKQTLLVGSVDITNEILNLKTKFTFLSFTESDCRYGEPAFTYLEEKLIEFKADICLYLETDFFLPKLYLVKKSGAPCRIGFFAEPEFPFLNVSLKSESDDSLSKVKILIQQYGDPLNAK